MAKSKRILLSLLAFGTAHLIGGVNSPRSEYSELSEGQYIFSDGESEEEGLDTQRLSRSGLPTPSKSGGVSSLMQARSQDFSGSFVDASELCSQIDSLGNGILVGEGAYNSISSLKDPTKKWNKMLSLLDYTQKEKLFSELREDVKYSTLKAFLELQDLIVFYPVESAEFYCSSGIIPTTVRTKEVGLHTDQWHFAVTQDFLNNPQNWQESGEFEIARLFQEDNVASILRKKGENSYNLVLLECFDSLIKGLFEKAGGNGFYDLVIETSLRGDRAQSKVLIKQRFNSNEYFNQLQLNLEKLNDSFEESNLSDADLRGLFGIYSLFGNSFEYDGIKKLISKLIVRSFLEGARFEYFISDMPINDPGTRSLISAEFKAYPPGRFCPAYGVRVCLNQPAGREAGKSPICEVFIDIKDLMQVFLGADNNKKTLEKHEICKKGDKLHVYFNKAKEFHNPISIED